MNLAQLERQPLLGRAWLFASLGLLLGVLCSGAGAAGGEVAMQAAQAKALGVQAQPVAPAAEAVTELSGKLSLPVRQQQLLSAPVDGLVTAVLVDEGDAVRAGQPLLRLRSTQLPNLQREHRQAEG